jgi:hypothetical protein
VGRIFQHRSETEEIAVTGFIDEDLLMALVHGGHLDLAGYHDVGVFAGFSNLVDSLTWSESLDLHLRGENSHLVVVEQRKEWNLSQVFCLASHRSPHSCL